MELPKQKVHTLNQELSSAKTYEHNRLDKTSIVDRHRCHMAAKIESMIRKYHSHKPQTTLWHREEEPLNHHETPGSHIKQSNRLSLPHQDDCNTRQQPKPPGGLNAFYWPQIFALDSAVVEVHEMFSSHGGHLTNAM